MLDATVQGTGNSSSQEPLAPRTKHIGLLSADSIAFYIGDTSDPFIFQLTRDITFGRQAPNAPMQPTIDLSAFGAYEKGVSRLHAVIRRTASGDVEVEDLASGNGTWLNDIRIEPHVSSPIKSGDLLILGKLRIEIYLGDSGSMEYEEKDPGHENDLLKTLHVTGGLHAKDKAASVSILQPLAPRLSHYHGRVSLDLHHTVNEIGSILVRIVPQLLKLKDCEIKLTLLIDAHGPACFDESTIRGVQSVADDLNLDESEFRP